MQLTSDKLIFSILIICASFFVLIVFFMIVIVNNYKKNKSRQEDTLKVIYQTQEKERLRIAQDLHDNLGAMLSTIKYYVTAMSSQNDSQKSDALTSSALSH